MGAIEMCFDESHLELFNCEDEFMCGFGCRWWRWWLMPGRNDCALRWVTQLGTSARVIPPIKSTRYSTCFACVWWMCMLDVAVDMLAVLSLYWTLNKRSHWERKLFLLGTMVCSHAWGYLDGEQWELNRCSSWNICFPFRMPKQNVNPSSPFRVSSLFTWWISESLRKWKLGSRAGEVLKKTIYLFIHSKLE